jgi:hypothetical protein
VIAALEDPLAVRKIEVRHRESIAVTLGAALQDVAHLLLRNLPLSPQAWTRQKESCKDSSRHPNGQPAENQPVKNAHFCHRSHQPFRYAFIPCNSLREDPSGCHLKTVSNQKANSKGDLKPLWITGFLVPLLERLLVSTR